MSKHTPGPWIADGDLILAADNWRVASCHRFPNNDDTARPANARLIAAAPELLEALQAIAGTDPVDSARDPQHLVAIARAAIAKAEGRCS